MITVIDPSWVELQTGLYLEEKYLTIGGVSRLFRYLHSSEGYCFYDAEDANDPPVYAQYAALAISMSSWTYEQLNAKWISIPIEEGMEIVSAPNSNVTI